MKLSLLCKALVDDFNMEDDDSSSASSEPLSSADDGTSASAAAAVAESQAEHEDDDEEENESNPWPSDVIPEHFLNETGGDFKLLYRLMHTHHHIEKHPENDAKGHTKRSRCIVCRNTTTWICSCTTVLGPHQGICGVNARCQHIHVLDMLDVECNKINELLKHEEVDWSAVDVNPFDVKLLKGMSLEQLKGLFVFNRKYGERNGNPNLERHIKEAMLPLM